MPLLIRVRLMNDLRIHAEFLSRCRAGEERKQEGEVIKIADDPFDADQRDVNRGNRCDHAPIAFVGDEAHAAGFSDRKIRAADSDICCEENFS